MIDGAHPEGIVSMGNSWGHETSFGSFELQRRDWIEDASL